MKQGDVISPLLFNAALEVAFEAQKERLTYHGILLAENVERLTNIRYADDVMLYAKSLEELHDMLTMLMEELAKIGLHLNGSKTKILTTVANPPHFLDVDESFIQILQVGEFHRYLGRHCREHYYKDVQSRFSTGCRQRGINFTNFDGN